MTTMTLHFGPTIHLVDHTVAGVRLMRAFALVCPKTWGRADWKEQVAAVLHPSDLEAAGVTIEAVVEAVAFFTATEATVTRCPIHATPEIEAFVVKADGYRRGPAH